jgi:hypothetical protein
MVRRLMLTFPVKGITFRNIHWFWFRVDVLRIYPGCVITLFAAPSMPVASMIAKIVGRDMEPSARHSWEISVCREEKEL